MVCKNGQKIQIGGGWYFFTQWYDLTMKSNNRCASVKKLAIEKIQKCEWINVLNPLCENKISNYLSWLSHFSGKIKFV